MASTEYMREYNKRRSTRKDEPCIFCGGEIHYAGNGRPHTRCKKCRDEQGPRIVRRRDHNCISCGNKVVYSGKGRPAMTCAECVERRARGRAEIERLIAEERDGGVNG